MSFPLRAEQPEARELGLACGRASSQHRSSTETEDPLLLNWQKVNLLVKILLGSTCSYPSTVQGARGSVGQLTST